MDIDVGNLKKFEDDREYALKMNYSFYVSQKELIPKNAPWIDISDHFIDLKDAVDFIRALPETEKVTALYLERDGGYFIWRSDDNPSYGTDILRMKFDYE